MRTILITGLLTAIGVSSMGRLNAAPSGGSLEIEYIFGPAYFTLTGADFRVTGAFDSIFPNYICLACVPPTVVPMHVQAGYPDFQFWSGVFFGREYGPFTPIPHLRPEPGLPAGIVVDSRMVFEAPEVTVTGPGTYTGQFTMFAYICGVKEPLANLAETPCLVEFRLAGAGQFAMEVRHIQDSTELWVPRTTYSFPEPVTLVSFASIPEPTSLGLIGGGLFVVFLLSRSKKIPASANTRMAS